MAFGPIRSTTACQTRYPHVASWLTPPAAAPSAAADDAQILALFRQWTEAHRFIDALPDGSDFDAAGTSICAVELAIMAIPATGAPGLAIKTYVRLHDDFASPSVPGGLRRPDSAWISILEDAVCFAPELAPLAAIAPVTPAAD